MRRSTAKVKKLAGALGLILALPPFFAAAADHPGAGRVSSLAEFAQSASVLDAWREYALADLTLDFSWARDAIAPLAAPTLFDRGIAHIAPPASHFAGAGAAASALSVTLSRTKASDTPLFLPAEAPSLVQDYTPGLQRYILTPSYTQPWGENSALGVSAIFAYQRFAGLGLGLDSMPVHGGINLAAAPFGSVNTPGSYGTGMRVDFNSALNESVSWQVGYQSRVNMDAFNNYRGVYSEPGSFDIPASANIGLGYALTPDLKFDLGAERVMYSHIAPFTSAALPTRFLVLLGSSISPSFAWQDVDVYSVGWTWRDPGNGIWSLHYSTREQPLPTSRLLQSALDPYLAAHNVEFGFAHMFGPFSSLRLAATYAPTEFVLGLPTSNTLRNASDGNQLEYEALWTTRF
jgi:hypothetical protein